MNLISHKYLQRSQLLGVVFLLLVVWPAASFSQTEGLRGKISLTISGGKTEFIQYEQIELDLDIVNLTDETVAIPEPNWYQTIKIHLTDDQGKAVTSGCSVTALPPKTVDLPSRSRRSEPLDFGCHRNIEPSDLTIGGPQLAPGKYHVEVTFAGVRSNPFEFQIATPSAGDIEVLTRINHDLLGIDHEEAIKSAQMLLKQYPKSIYLPQVYNSLWIHCQNSKSSYSHADLMMQSVLDFVDKYPKSVLAGYAIKTYAKGADLKSGATGKTIKSLAQISSITSAMQVLKKRYATSDRIQRYIDENIQFLNKTK